MAKLSRVFCTRYLFIICFCSLSAFCFWFCCVREFLIYTRLYTYSKWHKFLLYYLCKFSLLRRIQLAYQVGFVTPFRVSPFLCVLRCIYVRISLYVRRYLWIFVVAAVMHDSFCCASSISPCIFAIHELHFYYGSGESSTNTRKQMYMFIHLQLLFCVPAIMFYYFSLQLKHFLLP